MVNHPNRSKAKPIDWTLILKDAVIGKLIAAYVEDGMRVEVSDQDGGGLHIYAWPAHDDRPADGFKHWVKIVFENGPGTMISDYSQTTERAIKGVLDFCAAFDTDA